MRRRNLRVKNEENIVNIIANDQINPHISLRRIVTNLGISNTSMQSNSERSLPTLLSYETASRSY